MNHGERLMDATFAALGEGKEYGFARQQGECGATCC